MSPQAIHIVGLPTRALRMSLRVVTRSLGRSSPRDVGLVYARLGSSRLYCVLSTTTTPGASSSRWRYHLRLCSRQQGIIRNEAGYVPANVMIPCLQQVCNFSAGAGSKPGGEASAGPEAAGEKADAGEGDEKGTDQEEKKKKKKKEGEGEEEEEEPDPEDYQPEEKIGFLRGLLYLTLAGIAIGSLYVIGKELLPSRMSPNYLFNEAFEDVKKNHEIINRFGEPLKGYGRDSGGRREGRRNFVEHKKYKGEDGLERLRIRFNIEGPFGHAFVFAEVTSEMNAGEWSYLLVQDLQTGRVYTLQDNRAMIDAMHKAKSPEEKAALARLIKGGQ